MKLLLQRFVLGGAEHVDPVPERDPVGRDVSVELHLLRLSLDLLDAEVGLAEVRALQQELEHDYHAEILELRRKIRDHVLRATGNELRAIEEIDFGRLIEEAIGGLPPYSREFFYEVDLPGTVEESLSDLPR